MSAVDAIIRDLRVMAAGPRQDWMRIGRAIEASPRVLTADAGIQGVTFCSVARIVAPTCAHANQESETHCRALLANLADALGIERAANAVPYHQRGER